MTFPQHAKSMIGALTQARWCSYTSKLQSLQSIDDDNECCMGLECLCPIIKLAVHGGWRGVHVIA